MYLEMEDFGTGIVSLDLVLNSQDIDLLIANLIALKEKEDGSHFVIQNNKRKKKDVFDIEIHKEESHEENSSLLSFDIKSD